VTILSLRVNLFPPSLSLSLSLSLSVSRQRRPTYTGCRVGVDRTMHARWGSCALRTPHRHAGAEWKGKELVARYSCLLACHRRDYVSCLANPFSASHGTGAHGAVAAADASPRVVHARERNDQRREEGYSERTEADECGRQGFSPISRFLGDPPRSTRRRGM
jgi:hypothetical protein